MTLLTVEQVAELLAVHESTVLREAAAGHLPSIQVRSCRRFHPDDVEDYINRQRGRVADVVELRVAK